MSYILLGMLVLVVYHFVFESILAPSWRLSIRYRLFALRDELRMLKIEHRDQLDDKHYHHLQDSINSIIYLLPKIEVVMVAHIKQSIEQDVELKKRLEARQKVLDDCAFPIMVDIRKRSINLTIEALAANSAGWSAYIVPFLLLSGVYKSIEPRVRALVSLSDPDIAKIAPEIRSNGAMIAF